MNDTLASGEHMKWFVTAIRKYFRGFPKIALKFKECSVQYLKVTKKAYGHWSGFLGRPEKRHQSRHACFNTTSALRWSCF